MPPADLFSAKTSHGTKKSPYERVEHPKCKMDMSFELLIFFREKKMGRLAQLPPPNSQVERRKEVKIVPFCLIPV